MTFKHQNGFAVGEGVIWWWFQAFALRIEERCGEGGRRVVEKQIAGGLFMCPVWEREVTYKPVNEQALLGCWKYLSGLTRRFDSLFFCEMELNCMLINRFE